MRTRISQGRPIEETVSFVERPLLDQHGVANFAYEHEDLPFVDPLGWGGIPPDRQYTLGVPDSWAAFTFGNEGTSAIPAGSVAMQPLANPTTTNVLSQDAQTF
jgi:hypothetical protein